MLLPTRPKSRVASVSILRVPKKSCEPPLKVGDASLSQLLAAFRKRLVPPPASQTKEAAWPDPVVNVTASRDVPSKLATITGGRVGGPTDIEGIWDGYGEGNRVMHERTELLLWNSGLLFLLVAGLLTAEWLIRKRAGIA